VNKFNSHWKSKSTKFGHYNDNIFVTIDQGASSMMAGSQVRMARAYLRWSVADLADKAKIGISTVQRIEQEDGPVAVSGVLEWQAAAREQSIQAVHDTLVRAGVTFLPDDGNGVGVRVKGKTMRAHR
jgi:hypothetical protein